MPDWSRFSNDYADHEGKLHGEQGLLIRTLKRYCEVKGLETDWNVLENLPIARLVNSLSMALPLSEQDKQVLLETVKPVERLHTFTALLNSELEAPGSVTRH